MGRDRLRALRDAMRSEGVDLLALGPGAHMRWLLGFEPHGDERLLLLLVTADGAGFVMPALEADSAGRFTTLPMRLWTDAEGPGGALDAVLGALRATGARKVAVDETMRADFALTLLDRLPGVERVFAESTIGRLRMLKDAAERAALKRSSDLADKAVRAAMAAMRPGVTEAEIARVVEDTFARAGATTLFTIIGAGPNGAFPHHQTGDTPLRAGDAVVLDIGARLDGAPSDITRMAIIGEKPAGYDEIHAIVEGAVLAGLAAARPGALAREVDEAARGHIAAHGYGDFFLHRTGHGLGVEVHEPPYVTGSSETVLEEGMVFSIEPGIYLPGRFGIRLEEIVYLTGAGAERFSDLPRAAVLVTGD
ncbi:MAG: peptidase M24 [Rhodovulum sulfidophilum]|uniref:Peptidase M24 n=1 Tax=Rhodovulum sulfidophilum TaxID=35806 RepID=A0A2W5PTS0_RHOSU|nr:MAG: peptidase M24 [Rhodovulum sulfidophilum]